MSASLAGVGMVRGVFPAALLAVLVLAGCDRPPAPEPAQPAANPQPGITAGTASAEPAAVPEAPPASGMAEPVTAPETISTDLADAETRSVRAEVLKRIDVMPNLGDEEKDKLYVQVERARGLAKVITVPFASGARSVAPASAAGIQKALTLPQVEKFSSDPTVAFVVLGYADRKGDPQANQKISLDRAEEVVRVLKDRARVMNVIHAVGMGGSEMFDPKALDKNRVVEVWAVLP